MDNIREDEIKRKHKKNDFMKYRKLNNGLSKETGQNNSQVRQRSL